MRTMALLTTMPSSITRPRREVMFTEEPVTASPRKEPTMAKGMEMSTTMGKRRDSNCTAITAKTK